MESLKQSIYHLLLNFHKQNTEIKHAIDWCEQELKNPTLTEGYSLEEKVQKLTETKNELEEKWKNFKELRNKETLRLKTICEDEAPGLWNFVEAKLLTDLMITSHLN